MAESLKTTDAEASKLKSNNHLHWAAVCSCENAWTVQESLLGKNREMHLWIPKTWEHTETSLSDQKDEVWWSLLYESTRSGQRSLKVSSEPAHSWFDWFLWKLFEEYARKLQKQHKSLGCPEISSRINALALRASASTCAGKVALNIATCQSEDWNDWMNPTKARWKLLKARTTTYRYI